MYCNVRMYVCMYVCNVCIYIMYVYMYVCVCTCICMYVCLGVHMCVCICVLVCMYACIHLGVYKMFSVYFVLCNKFGLHFCSQSVFRILFPRRLFILCRFSPFNSCSSPSSFPSFHNLFSDLLSTTLPGIDKGVVQSQIALGRKRNTVPEKIRRH
jgi:hypothetical protein